ncbi:MAG: hypothetical protein AABY27_05610, partial [Pseudomonadota bacterium]
MKWGNENNRDKSPWDDDSQKNSKEAGSHMHLDEIFKRSHNSFNDAYKKFKKNDEPGINKKFFGIIGTALLLLWLSTGFYVVDEGEQALV